jgi:predicted RNase H-like nuclease
MPRVLGVDACKAGWVGVVLDDESLNAFVAPTIGSLVDRALAQGALDTVAIDMPIGLPDAGPRRADLLARATIGRLASSVFTTPVRDALLAATHAEAVAINREMTGQGLSIQAYGLRTKLFEVDSWVRQAAVRVVEVHPEVSFAVLAGAPLTVRKSTWAGAERRRRLLHDAGIQLTGELGLAEYAVGVDDVLDAGAAAWSARRVHLGIATCLPDPPQTFHDGWPSAIWA